MEYSRQAETFSDALFTYLMFTENIISGKTAVKTVGVRSDFIAEVVKAVLFVSTQTGSAFEESMEEYFMENDMSQRKVFTFLTRYCFNYHAENCDIFAVVLHTCSFVYRLAFFCNERGRGEYFKFASMCWAEIFQMDLKRDFYASGGWGSFRKYVASNRYGSPRRVANHKSIFEFLDSVNDLLLKIEIAEPEELTNCFTDESEACTQLEVSNSTESVGASPSEMLKRAEFCQSSDPLNNSSISDPSEESADESNARNSIITEVSDMAPKKKASSSYLEKVVHDLVGLHIYKDCKDGGSYVPQSMAQTLQGSDLMLQKDEIGLPALPVTAESYDDKGI